MKQCIEQQDIESTNSLICKISGQIVGLDLCSTEIPHPDVRAIWFDRISLDKVAL